MARVVRVDALAPSAQNPTTIFFIILPYLLPPAHVNVQANVRDHLRVIKFVDTTLMEKSASNTQSTISLFI